MDTSALTLFNALGEKMNYLTQRQRVLAQNIANANTPRYIPSDLKPFTFEETIDRHHLMMKTSNVKHMDGTLGSPRPFTSPEQRRIYESSPDGNGVVTQEELALMKNHKKHLVTLEKEKDELKKKSPGLKECHSVNISKIP